MNDPAKNAESLFGQAIEIESAGERAAFLQQACGDDRQLRADVEKLVVDHFRAGSFLEEPALSGNAATTDPPVAEFVGTRIGPYKLLQVIGEGGFGVVYMAEQQQPIRRRVALKIIKPGMDSKQVIARFEAERQALALMDHQNIARVYDAGRTDAGRPYFVMELVRGIPITEYCDRHTLTISERLGLFVQVCNALQHAHQKGIIHRDIKPSNVIVTLYDGRPESKVIDFGVAKSIEQPLTEKTMFTAYGQMIGTIEYMAPEQAEMGGLDIDTRADIYALGVLLYELLTGSTPFSKEKLRNAAFDDMLRTIREEEPVRPSLRLQQTGNSLAEVSAMRQMDPARLTRFIKGDLDWIVMKSLEKDRKRRYETANALAADVNRYLTHEAVDATPPSSLYRFRKFARKNKNVLAVVSAFMLLLACGTVVSTWLAVCADAAKKLAIAAHEDAVRQRDKAEKTTLDMQAIVCRKDTILGGNAWSEGNLNQVRSLLSRHVPVAGEEDLRTFEWYLLWGLSQRQLQTAKSYSFSAMTNALAVSSDGRCLAVGHDLGGVTLFDLRGNREIDSFGMASPLWRPFVAFSPDGRELAYLNGMAHQIMVRNIESGEQRQLFPLAAPLREFHFSRDWKLAATATFDYTIRLWDVTTGELLHTFSPVHEDSSGEWEGKNWQAIAFSPDGKTLAAARPNHAIKLWNADTFAERNVCSGHTGTIFDIEFSPDGSLLASCGDDGTLRIWDSETGDRKQTLWVSHLDVLCVAFSDDGTSLAAGGGDNTVRVWDVATMMEREVLRGHSGSVISVTFVPGSDGELLSGSTDKKVICWDMKSIAGNSAFVCRASRGALSLSPDGCSIASIKQDQIHIRDWSGKVTNPVFQHDPRPTCIAVSNEQKIALHCNDDTIRLVESAATKVETAHIPVPDLNVTRLAYSPDGKILAVASESGQLLLIDTDNGIVRHRISAHDRKIDITAFSPLGDRLATGSQDRTLKLWDIESGKCERVIRFDGSVRAIAFSPCGTDLALGGFDPTLMVVDLSAPLSQPRRIEAHNGGISSLAYSADGTILASGGVSGSLQLWEASSLQQRLAMTPYHQRIQLIAFSPDGQTLLIANPHGKGRFLRAATKQEVESADWYDE